MLLLPLADSGLAGTVYHCCPSCLSVAHKVLGSQSAGLSGATDGGTGLVASLATAAAATLLIALCWLHSIATGSRSTLEPRAGPTWKVMVAYVLINLSKLVRPRRSQLG